MKLVWPEVMAGLFKNGVQGLEAYRGGEGEEEVLDSLIRALFNCQVEVTEYVVRTLLNFRALYESLEFISFFDLGTEMWGGASKQQPEEIVSLFTRIE